MSGKSSADLNDISTCSLDSKVLACLLSSCTYYVKFLPLLQQNKKQDCKLNQSQILLLQDHWKLNQILILLLEDQLNQIPNQILLLKEICNPDQILMLLEQICKLNHILMLPEEI